jgi:hypothetical protein
MKDFECFFLLSLSLPPLSQTLKNPYSYAHATIIRKKDDPYLGHHALHLDRVW